MLRNKYAYNLYTSAFRKLFKKKFENLLEAGCGPACNTPLINNYAKKVVCIDISSKMVKKAKEFINKKKLKNISVKKASIDNLPFKNKEFDCIFGLNILHHAYSEKAIKEMKRTLKKNGVYIGIEPNVLNPLTAVFHILRSGEGGAFKINHFFIKKKLKGHFKDVKIMPLNITLISLNKFTYWLVRAFDFFTSNSITGFFSINYAIIAK